MFADSVVYIFLVNRISLGVCDTWLQINCMRFVKLWGLNLQGINFTPLFINVRNYSYNSLGEKSALFYHQYLNLIFLFFFAPFCKDTISCSCMMVIFIYRISFEMFIFVFIIFKGRNWSLHMCDCCETTRLKYV